MYFWSVFFHLIFISFWIGGMLFTGAVLVPATRNRLKSQRSLLMAELGTRFSRISWILFILILLTGLLALYGRGFPTEAILSASFWDTPYGSALMGKLHLFATVLIISGIHDFWLGPKAVRLMESDEEPEKARKYTKASSWVGRINLILGLAILFYAVDMIR
jgi:putative copper export protein